MLLMLFTGIGFGATCATCARSPLSGGGDEVVGNGKHRVGVVELTGAIVDTGETVRTLRGFAKREDLDALVIRIDSPGGGVAPSQELYQALREAAKDKPVVASMGSVAASGGYWTALGADWIFASPGSLTGSIGVISQLPDLRALADLARFNMRTFKSGPHKDIGSPLREMTADDEAVFMDLIRDIYDQFVGLVIERRHLSREAVLHLADGRVMSGRVAFDAGLVDQLGGLYDAARKGVALAEAKKPEKEREKLKAGEETEEPTLVYPRKPMPGFLRLLSEELGEGLGRGLAEGIDRGAIRAANHLAGGNPNVELR
jgi:protease-4